MTTSTWNLSTLDSAAQLKERMDLVSTRASLEPQGTWLLRSLTESHTIVKTLIYSLQQSSYSSWSVEAHPSLNGLNAMMTSTDWSLVTNPIFSGRPTSNSNLKDFSRKNSKILWLQCFKSTHSNVLLLLILLDTSGCRAESPRKKRSKQKWEEELKSTKVSSKKLHKLRIQELQTEAEEMYLTSK